MPDEWIINEDHMAKAFEEWQRQYQADPAAFMAHEESAALEPLTYGQLSARHFVRMLSATEKS